ncbi:hypothetical protein COCSADRAFT_35870 [Bipolaris sorokiniana ND90Pr]|uniref:Uncharacterized protein n=1 Tax=Cochliobolus sativus (strain ND90Pr / ATCC 201652) TaxID=665912 RepID=M2SF50_COCSN|nr:uncharacterized protein COCSADRAFT_35870 [Bipolaris sorokiniana ND90Pr]EMD65908.1 hypothetical protein COCSADRAFT_35870 [Bipolaris sorokiniana ND90Pr]
MIPGYGKASNSSRSATVRLCAAFPNGMPPARPSSRTPCLCRTHARCDARPAPVIPASPIL